MSSVKQKPPTSARRNSKIGKDLSTLTQSGTAGSQNPSLPRQNDSVVPSEVSQKTKKSIRLSDLMAAMYPGIKIGHKFCVQNPVLVPATMGWLWITEDTATGVPFPRGWRPGAIALGVKKRFFKPGTVSEPLSTPIGAKKKLKKKKTPSSSNICSSDGGSRSFSLRSLPPTLFVHKERGVYQVKMQPIKHPARRKEEDPVQFKIADESNTSCSWNSKSSSSSLKIEYMCSGALREPVKKPELAEAGTQYETIEIPVIEENKESIRKEVKPEKKKGKKGKE